MNNNSMTLTNTGLYYINIILKSILVASSTFHLSIVFLCNNMPLNLYCPVVPTNTNLLTWSILAFFWHQINQLTFEFNQQRDFDIFTVEQTFDDISCFGRMNQFVSRESLGGVKMIILIFYSIIIIQINLVVLEVYDI